MRTRLVYRTRLSPRRREAVHADAFARRLRDGERSEVVAVPGHDALERRERRAQLLQRRRERRHDRGLVEPFPVGRRGRIRGHAARPRRYPGRLRERRGGGAQPADPFAASARVRVRVVVVVVWNTKRHDDRTQPALQQRGVKRRRAAVPGGINQRVRRRRRRRKMKSQPSRLHRRVRRPRVCPGVLLRDALQVARADVLAHRDRLRELAAAETQPPRHLLQRDVEPAAVLRRAFFPRPQLRGHRQRRSAQRDAQHALLRAAGKKLQPRRDLERGVRRDVRGQERRVPGQPVRYTHRVIAL
eukprot:31555-Pelagococcus_subviridis.AAC.4